MSDFSESDNDNEPDETFEFPGKPFESAPDGDPAEGQDDEPFPESEPETYGLVFVVTDHRVSVFAGDGGVEVDPKRPFEALDLEDVLVLTNYLRSELAYR